MIEIHKFPKGALHCSFNLSWIIEILIQLYVLGSSFLDDFKFQSDGDDDLAISRPTLLYSDCSIMKAKAPLPQYFENTITMELQFEKYDFKTN